MRATQGLTVWARDTSRRRVGILTVLDGSVFLPESGVGTWTATVDAKQDLAQRLTDGWGVLIVDAGRLVLSGPVVTIQHDVKGSASTLTLTGVSDSTVLADRLVYPDPARPAEQQTTVTHYKETGPGEQVLANIINRQAGPSALAARRTPGIAAVPTGTRGARVPVEARFTVLADEVQSLARAAGLVVDVVQSATSTDLVVEIRTPADRSRSCRFMPQTGLGDYTTKVTPAAVSTVIVGAGGQGTARVVIERSAPGASRRVERFQDRRDSTDPAELEKAAAETLAENAATASASFDVTEAAGLRFGADYRLGDLVSVVPRPGMVISDRLRAAEISWTPTGRDVKLTVGENTTDTERTPAWVRKVRDLQKQLRRIGGAQ